MAGGFNFEALLAAAVFTGARVSGLMVFCPFLGSDAVPVPVKAGLTLLLTILLHPLHGPAGLALGLWQWARVGLGEVVVGPDNDTTYYYRVASRDGLGRLGNWSAALPAAAG